MLPYGTVGIAKFSGGGYDNAAPRQWTEGLQGWPRRMEWAHRNHFEAFPAFAAGVLVAHVTGVAETADWLAGAFVACGWVTRPLTQRTGQGCGRRFGSWRWRASWDCSSRLALWTPCRDEPPHVVQHRGIALEQRREGSHNADVADAGIDAAFHRAAKLADARR